MKKKKIKKKKRKISDYISEIGKNMKKFIIYGSMALFIGFNTTVCHVDVSAEESTNRISTVE